MAREDERSSREHTGIPPRAKALMVLIAVVTILAVWLVPSDKEEAPPPLPEMATPPREDRAIPLPPSPPSEGEKEPAMLREGDRARAIIARLRAEHVEPDPNEIFAHAEQLQSRRHADDAYLLYRFAARQGHAQAALVLGSQADPAFYSSEISILPEPDLQQAYKWYRVAATAGSEEAVTRLQRLRERVEQSAADGNGQARQLMLQWQ